MDKETSQLVLEGQAISGTVLDALDKYRLVFFGSPGRNNVELFKA
jgi:hypothetical protein